MGNYRKQAGKEKEKRWTEGGRQEIKDDRETDRGACMLNC